MMDAIAVEVPDDRTDLLLAALGPDGVTKWARVLPMDGIIELARIQVLEDGDILMGGGFFELDLGEGPLPKPLESFLQVFVARFDATGALKWSRTFGTGEQRLRSLSHDAAGNILLCGTFQEQIGFGGDPLVAPMNESEPFVVKLGASGERIWDRTYHVEAGLSNDDDCVLEADAAGNLYLLGGGFVGTLELDDVKLVSEGTGHNPYLLRLDPDGTAVWGRNFPTLGVAVTDTLVVQPDGTSWVGGRDSSLGKPYATINFGQKSQGCNDRPCGFIASFDADGASQQAFTLESSISFNLDALASDGAGGVIATGYLAGDLALGGLQFASETDDVPVGLVVRLDAGMAPLWGQRVVASFDGTPRFGGPATVRAGRVGVLGEYKEVLTVDPLMVEAEGTEVYHDLFVLSLGGE